MKNRKYLKVIGNKIANGIIKASGSKNAALPIIAASLFLEGEVILNNVPDILDVRKMLDILTYLNVKYSYENNKLIINAKDLEYKDLNIKEVSSLRASYYLIPILLNENSSLEFINVGGCNFEKRPIDIHLELIKKVGGKIREIDNGYLIKVNTFSSLEHSFKNKSVGATINAILIGLKTKKKVKITNYALDPEIMDFITFLQRAGLLLEMDDNSITFQRKTPLKGIEYTIMPDRIEAETYALIGLGLGRVGIFDFIKEHHEAFLLFLNENNVVYSLEDNFLLINKEEIKKSNILILDHFPSLSTDIGPILLTYLLGQDKMFVIKDNVYHSRLSKLRFFNSCFSFQFDSLLVNPRNVEKRNNTFYGSNLRDTMAYLYFALTHEGEYYIYGYEHLIRGYENIIDKLISLDLIVEIEDED
ncbi:MAG: hypothetical protein E7177_07460 [Erysipelotrichaceae bacterium]|nr:hypothetical protein [Erysipelotrichaceae bacterium]